MATQADAEAMGFKLPTGDELMSGGDDAISQNALAATEGIIDAKFYKGNPGGVDVDTLKDTAVYAWGVPHPVGLTGLPEDATDALILVVHGHDLSSWAAQDLYQYGRDPKRWWRISETTASWGPWQELNTTEQAMAANAAQQSQMIAATGGAVDTGGKAAFALRIDHGYNNYKTKLRDGLLSRGIVPGIATNSRNWGLAENNAVTLTEVDGWVAAGEIEILNHGATHGKSQANLHDEIVNGKTELEAQLPSATVYGFAPPGDSEWWGGFQGGKIGGWGDPAAGIILANHAYSLGYVGGARRVLDGTIRQALSHITLDKYDMAQARAQVDAAIAERRGIQVMLHADWLDTTGNLTTADFLAFLDYVVAKRTAGDLVTLSPNELMLADSTRPPVEVDSVDGLAARLAALEYKSGPRDITSRMSVQPVSGTLYLERIGDVVWCDMSGIRMPASAGFVQLVDLFPVGFRPRRIQDFATAKRNNTDPAGALRVDFSGTAYFYVVDSTRYIRGVVSWPTRDAPPSTLPGTPA